MSGDDCVSVHLTIRGRVQGVGYREWLRRQAVAQGLCGWVRNRRDGTVEAEFEGHEQQVDEVLAWMSEGPPGATVTGARVTEVSPLGETAFDVRGDD